MRSIAVFFKSFTAAFKLWRKRNADSQYLKDQYELMMSGKEYDSIVDDIEDEGDDVAELSNMWRNASLVTFWRASYLNMMDETCANDKNAQ